MERPKGLNVDLPVLSRSIVWQGQGNNEPQQLELQLYKVSVISARTSSTVASITSTMPGLRGNWQFVAIEFENPRKFIKAVELMISAVQLFLA